ncbi:MAG: hypothetical protein IRZ24_04810 [Thermogemmatispora sp.]|uniref:MvdC/MvdD family ATP grasp protein n=1 Tax=Thermogemmatispora sp. TaxID=1968838 RepID=UPI001D4CFE5F|nr:hypothetical protein [Thermogemmatispora sp.]MBX5449368.1 hypothetical protein [Thermogemmatispora sp.]
MTVLILSQAADAHVPPVLQILRQRGTAVHWVDTADFPEHLSLRAELQAGTPCWHGTLSSPEQQIDLAAVHSIWWRRPQRYRAPALYAPAVRAFIEREAPRGLLGVLRGTIIAPQPFWVNPREALEAAEYKPAQLCAACAVGLRVPRTLVTNDPEAVRRFAEACEGRIIGKALARGILEEPGGTTTAGERIAARFLYTSAIFPEHLQQLEGVRTTAHLFQERLPKAFDLRVVIMGRQVFAIEIHAPPSSEAALDWRRAYRDLHYQLHELPAQIVDQLQTLVRRFGLQFAAADLLVTPEGEYVFLELNPNGQWYWLEPATGLPLAAAMANLLQAPEEYGL